MRVLHLIDSLVPGGAEKSLASIAPHLIARGVELDVAYLKDRPGLQRDFEQAGAQLFCLDGPGSRWGCAKRAAALVRTRQPDLVHTTLAEANLVGRAVGVTTRTPVVCSLVNVQYGPEHRSDPNVRPWRMRVFQTANALSARVVVSFHAVTEDVAAAMSRRLLIRKDRVEVIPRGRDPEVLGIRTSSRARRVRARIEIPPRAPMILAAARHEHQKRLDLLIRAFPFLLDKFPETCIMIAGREGSCTGLLRDLVHTLGLNGRVRFLGHRDDVPDLLCAADAIALTSDREGLPGVLIEAMALEAPIVATDLPGVREAVGGTDVAVLVDRRDPARYAHAITSVLQDPKMASQRAALGRVRFLANFTIDRVADRFVDFYERALEGRTLKRTF